MYFHFLVFISDLLIFYPSVIFLLKHLFKTTNNKASKKKSEKKDNNSDAYYELNLIEKDLLFTILLVLLNPTIVLIDHGHFQYNCISLGFTQLAIYFLVKSNSIKLKHLTFSSFLFCMALNYKQMELYHALPFFFYLLGLSLVKSDSYTQGYTIKEDYNSFCVNSYFFLLKRVKIDGHWSNGRGDICMFMDAFHQKYRYHTPSFK